MLPSNSKQLRSNLCNRPNPPSRINPRLNLWLIQKPNPRKLKRSNYLRRSQMLNQPNQTSHQIIKLLRIRQRKKQSKQNLLHHSLQLTPALIPCLKVFMVLRQYQGYLSRPTKLKLNPRNQLLSKSQK